MVLLDVGQCKALPANRLRALARVVIALDDDQPLSIALAMSGFGMDFTVPEGIDDPLALIRIIAFICFDVRWIRIRALSRCCGC